MSGAAYERIRPYPVWPLRLHGRSQWLRRLGLLVACAATIAAWAVLAPARLGGSLVYMVVDGSSMQPRLHSGDLALLDSTAGDYRPGEVVAYRNPQLGRIVLHRVIGERGGRYVFKGDRNNFVDFYQPSRSELIGRLWVRIPAAGGPLLWLRTPLHLGVLGVPLGLLLVTGGKRRRGGRQASGRVASRFRRAKNSPPRRESPLIAGLARIILALAALAGLGSALLILIGYSHPAVRVQAVPGAYRTQGSYGYRALTRPDSVYPKGRVATGQTVFPRLVRRVDLSFHYRFVSSLRSELSGSAQVAAVLRSGVGWRRTIANTGRVRFHGNSVTLSLPLDVQRLEAQIGSYLAETGIPNDSFDLLLTPTVSQQGRLGGWPLQTIFAPPPLDFVLDKYTIRLNGSPGAGPGQTSADQLHPAATGTLTRREPITLSLFGTRARVATVRGVGLFGLLAAAVLALLAAVVLRPSRRPGELGRIRRRYGHGIVTVTTPPAVPHRGYVELTSFDSLAHLATGLERIILHHQQADGHAFYLEDDGAVYRYQLRTRQPPQHARALGA